ncbi:ATP-binding protein [Streptomyces sp. Tue6028]|uniref:ATP-binding protein n=1 Tax=Streptomyces sp. Tue6028 TaxID=2036037 RepID=UPI003EC0745D
MYLLLTLLMAEAIRLTLQWRLRRQFAPSGGWVASWALASDPKSVREARHKTTDHLHRSGLSDLAFTASVVVSELVTNAVRHSAGPVHLRLVRGHSLTIEVTDDNRAIPQSRLAKDDEESGRGLSITSHLTERWGTRRESQGKTIWAELAVPAATEAADAA